MVKLGQEHYRVDEHVGDEVGFCFEVDKWLDGAVMAEDCTGKGASPNFVHFAGWPMHGLSVCGW